MVRVCSLCFTGLFFKAFRKQSNTQRSRESMENPSTSNVGNGVHSERSTSAVSSTTLPTNIIVNHDFSGGLHSWHPNCCDASVASAESGYPEGISLKSSSRCAIITNRKECWQGVEQDITSKVSPGTTYTVSACVGVSGPLQGFENVQATLKLVYGDSSTSYLFIARTSVSKERWEKLEGTFSLSNMPQRVVFYLEGPSPGVDLLIESVVVCCPSPRECGDRMSTPSASAGDENIILNPNFGDGLNNWSGRGCKIVTHDSMGDGKVIPLSGKVFAAATERTQSWNGIQQDITGRVNRKLAYEITAVVRIFGNNVTTADVRATLWVQTPDSREQYIGIAKFVSSTLSSFDGIIISLLDYPAHTMFVRLVYI